MTIKPKVYAVEASGPYADREPWGDEYPTWVVATLDYYGNCIDVVARYQDPETCFSHAVELAHRLGVELINEMGAA